MSELLPKKIESRGEKNLSPAEAHELQKNLAEKRAERVKDLEKSGNRTKEALKVVHEEAASAEDYSPPSETKPQQDTYKSEAKQLSFDTTMSGVRKNLNTAERSFSKFIHQPAVEKVSDVASKTIARPSGIAGAAIAAFIGVALVYGLAIRIGFELSGSEMPLLLLIGFLAGIILEWFYKSLRSILGKQKRSN